MHTHIDSTLPKLASPNFSLYLELQEAIRINMEGLLLIEVLLVALTIQEKGTFLVKSCRHLKLENNRDLLHQEGLTPYLV